ncbi:MAG: MarR family EPS-associated transcriptional regulator [Candidatus Omnitrophota bacterium]
MNEHPLKEDIFRILRVLASRDDLSQRDLSGQLDMSLGKTNYLLKSLAQRGLIKIMNFTTRTNKIKKVKYILTKEGFEEKLQLTYYYLKRKEKEYLELKRELEEGAQSEVQEEAVR